jgi:hypothetical protein
VGRRLGVAFGLIVLGWGLAAVPSARAHTCAEASSLDAGREATLGVAVTGHDVPAVGVTIQFDESFEVMDAAEPRDWTAEIDGNVVEYTGGEIPPQECLLFDVVVRPTEGGTFRVRPVLILEDGTEVEHPPNGDIFLQEDGSQVFVDRNGPPNPVFEQVVTVTGGTGGGTPVLALVGGGLWATIAVVGYLSWRRGWWRGPEPEPSRSRSDRARPQPRRRQR